MKRVLFIAATILIHQAAFTQNIDIGVASPDEQIHVDSAMRIGRNQVLSPLHKNLLKFGDGNYIIIGEEKNDDKLYIRFGRLALLPNLNRANDGFVGVNVDTATAQLDIDGTLRFRGIGEGAGHV